MIVSTQYNSPNTDERRKFVLAKVLSGATLGIDAYVVKVELDVSEGLPSFNTVGLPDIAIKEARDRVTAAIKNSAFNFPIKRVTANLAPADIRKEGVMWQPSLFSNSTPANSD